ncbi:MAG: hypothetical protein ACQER7_12145 [Bacteroidota bacterium]
MLRMTTTFEIPRIDTEAERIDNSFSKKVERTKAMYPHHTKMSAIEFLALLDPTDEELYYQCLLEIRNEDQSCIWEGFPANTPELEKELTDKNFLDTKKMIEEHKVGVNFKIASHFKEL